MRLDHVSYAAPIEHLAETVQRIGAALGAPFFDGGRHPSFGTTNFVLPLAGGTYIEVVGALDHPAAQNAPFGRAVAQRAALGGGWMSWVVAVNDIGPVQDRLGRQGVPGHRVRPDGFDLRWTQIGVLDTMAEALPFFVHWETDAAHHPSVGAAHDIRIASMEIAGDNHRICQWLGEPDNHPLDDVDVSWITAQPEAAGLLSVEFDTGHGRVRID